VLLDLRASSVGDRIALRCRRSGWDLLALHVAGAVEDPFRIPATLPAVPSLDGAPVARERTFTFEGHQRINGRRFALDRVDFRVPRGETELWRFVSRGGAPHPVHVHGTHFQVVSRRGGRGQVFPWERGWKDTVLLHDGETVEVRVRFDAHPGLFLLHCHRLEHEDGGMMLNFEVD
jgi:FtsP/CotA-like multicopper oxidase with cupredoxin domain